jgi:hypothetical protein
VRPSPVRPLVGIDAEALRQRIRDRLGDRMGSTGMAGIACEIGIGAPTLEGFLAGSKVYTATVKRIAAWLG